MTPTLTLLEPRLVPASPFPDAPTVPYTLLQIDAGQVAVAGEGGGPRVSRFDEAGTEVWSKFLADPASRHGANSKAVTLLLAAGGERVLSTAEVPATPLDIQIHANSIDGSAGSARRFDGLDLRDAGPADIGVGLVFRSAPASDSEVAARAALSGQVLLLLPDVGYTVYFVAVGPSISAARTALRYIEVPADSLDPTVIASDIVRRLSP